MTNEFGGSLRGRLELEALLLKTSRGLVSRFRITFYRMFGMKIGRRCRFEAIRARRVSQIEIGSFTALTEGCWLWPLDGPYEGCRIRIGSNNYFNRNVMIDACGYVEIGDDNLVGPDVYITNSNHRFLHGKPPKEQPMDIGTVKIGNGCWIGAHQFHLVSEIAPAYDFCWVPEQQALPYYRAVGAKPLHIQKGADPVFYRSISGVDRGIPVLFVGQLYADRARWLSRLLSRGIPVEIHTGAFANDNGQSAPIRRSLLREAFQDLEAYGSVYLMRWFIRMVATRRALTQIRTFARPSPDDEEMLHLFARSHLVLNFSHVYDGGDPGGRVKAHVRLRDFEAPMCRALYFPQYSDELPMYYDVEKEVVAWRSLDELVEKIRYYLSHPHEAERVREAGHRRALAEHTWEKRYQRLFRSMGLAV